MRLTYFASARVFNDKLGIEVVVPDSLNGWKATNENLDKHLDQDDADSGVIGGEIRVMTNKGKAILAVSYWLPQMATDEMIERLKRYTVAQLDDGIGEDGFAFDSNGKSLVVKADTDVPLRVEIVEDGRPIQNPSRIAISSRDGDIAALSAAIRAEATGLENLHQGYTALQLAILYGHIEAVQLLLAAGADPNRLDPDGSTPLELCALSNSIDNEQSRQLAQILLNAGANSSHVSPDGETAKSYAELRGKKRMAEIL